MSLPALIKEYLQDATLMQVATSHDGQPWACSVYFVHDDKLNLYWISKPDRRHSHELRRNSKVAGTIVLPHIPGDKVRGIQFEGTAKELTNPGQATEALNLYASRFGMDQVRINEILGGSDGHLCYKIEPKLYVLFDEVNYPDKPRQEWEIRHSNSASQ